LAGKVEVARSEEVACEIPLRLQERAMDVISRPPILLEVMKPRIPGPLREKGLTQRPLSWNAYTALACWTRLARWAK